MPVPQLYTIDTSLLVLLQSLVPVTGHVRLIYQFDFGLCATDVFIKWA